jgi:hypothetical protein
MMSVATALPWYEVVYSEPRYLEIKTPDGCSVLVLKVLLSSFIHNELGIPELELPARTVLAIHPIFMPHFQRLNPKAGRECIAFAKHWQIFSLCVPN